MIKFTNFDEGLIKNSSLIVQTVNPYGDHDSKAWYILSKIYPEALKEYTDICDLAKKKNNEDGSPLMGTMQEIYIDHIVPNIQLRNRTIINLFTNEISESDGHVINFNAFRSTVKQFKSRFSDVNKRIVFYYKINNKYEDINYIKNILSYEFSNYTDIFGLLEPAIPIQGSKYFY